VEIANTKITNYPPPNYLAPIK